MVMLLIPEGACYMVMTNCSVVGNRAGKSGGGFYQEYHPKPSPAFFS